jgi:hypothetical protein
MKTALAAIVLLASVIAGPAYADSCGRSRDYLLGGLAGELTMPPQAYQSLFKVCLATATMANVKDAVMLKDGGIGVIPKQDSVPATAGTLSTFCNAYPRGTLRFITRKDQRMGLTIGRLVRLSSTSSTPCKVIKGNAS